MWILVGNAERQWLLIAVSKNTGERGNCAPEGEQRGGGVFFITASKIISWYIKIELKPIFYSFFFYFWGQHCCLTDASIIRNDFLYFISFHCPQGFTALHPTAVPASLAKNHCGKLFAKLVKLTSVERTNSLLHVYELPTMACLLTMDKGCSQRLRYPHCSSDLCKKVRLPDFNTVLNDWGQFLQRISASKT